MTHPIIRVLNSSAIDRQARRVTSQSGCVEYDLPLDREELKGILARLERKHRLLKFILKVERPRQHDNLLARHKKGFRSNFRPTPVIDEYVRVGQALQIVIARLAELKAEGKEARQLLANIENVWRSQHPGCIWDGRQLVAPNGAIFSRVQANRDYSEAA